MRNWSLPFVLSLSAILSCSAASAAVVCVSSGPQLQTALNNAENNGEIDEIRLKPGLYFANPAAGEASFDYQSTEPLIIFGAAVDANNNCTSVAARSDQVVLSGTDQFAVMRLVANAGATGAWSVSHLTITNGVSSQSLAGGLSIRGLAGSSPIMSVINLIVKNGSNNAQANPQPTFRAYTEGNSTIRVLGCVFRDNTITTFTPLLLTGDSGTSISFSNNTIAYNWSESSEGPGSATYAPLDSAGGVALYLSNNVFYGNKRGSNQELFDFSVDTDFNLLQLDHNHFGNHAAFGVTDAFRTQGDPRFVSNTDLRLRLTSPLRNSGSNAPQGGVWTVDVEGSPRIQGGTVDRGAYEYGEMFINGFE